MIFLKNRAKAFKVGIGMISRVEVGLIVAGVGVTSGALSADIYAVIIMVARIQALFGLRNLIEKKNKMKVAARIKTDKFDVTILANLY